MNRTGFFRAAPVAMVLALAACGEPAHEAKTADVGPEPVATPTASDPLERDYTLTQAQQERRDAFDEAAFRKEYSSYATAIASEVQSGESASVIPTRENMQWGFMDRDNDGGLSMAEYAIWVLPHGSETGEGASELSSEQAGKLADSFVYYDSNGDGELSQREFTGARSGDLIR